MKWIGELYIIKEGDSPSYVYDIGEPDAFVETDTQEEAYNMLAHYVLTMCKGNTFMINIYKKN